MAALVGSDGNFASTSAGDAFMTRWRATFSVITTEITPFSEASYVNNVGGLLRIEGSASGAPDGSGTGDPGAAVSGINGDITLTVRSTLARSWTFPALINGFSFDVNKTGDSILTFDFVSGEGATALSEAWTAT